MVCNNLQSRQKERLDIIVVSSDELPAGDMPSSVGVADLIGVGDKGMAQGIEADALVDFPKSLFEFDIRKPLQKNGKRLGDGILWNGLPLLSGGNSHPRVSMTGAKNEVIQWTQVHYDSQSFGCFRPQWRGSRNSVLDSGKSNNSRCEVYSASWQLGAIGITESGVDAKQDHGAQLNVCGLDQRPQMVWRDESVLSLGSHLPFWGALESDAQWEHFQPWHFETVPQEGKQVRSGGVETSRPGLFPQMGGEAVNVRRIEIGGGDVESDVLSKGIEDGAIVGPSSRAEFSGVHFLFAGIQVSADEFAHCDTPDAKGLDFLPLFTRVEGSSNRQVLVERFGMIPPAAEDMQIAVYPLDESAIASGREGKRWIGLGGLVLFPLLSHAGCIHSSAPEATGQVGAEVGANRSECVAQLVEQRTFNP